jgi:hypothetical protein
MHSSLCMYLYLGRHVTWHASQFFILRHVIFWWQVSKSSAMLQLNNAGPEDYDNILCQDLNVKYASTQFLILEANQYFIPALRSQIMLPHPATLCRGICPCPQPSEPTTRCETFGLISGMWFLQKEILPALCSRSYNLTEHARLVPLCYASTV